MRNEPILLDFALPLGINGPGGGQLNKRPRPKLGQPCPCGSDRKYKDCCAAKQQVRRRTLRRSKKLLTWIGAIAVVAALIYGISLTSGVPYTDVDIGVVDFSGLNQREKRTALQAANQEGCSCGCGMTLAQCVATDSACPRRTPNISRIKTMVDQAREPRGGS